MCPSPKIWGDGLLCRPRRRKTGGGREEDDEEEQDDVAGFDEKLELVGKDLERAEEEAG